MFSPWPSSVFGVDTGEVLGEGRARSTEGGDITCHSEEPGLVGDMDLAGASVEVGAEAGVAGVIPIPGDH
jgi:hypothetical protein